MNRRSVFVNIVPLLNDIDDALVPLNLAPIKVKNSIYEWVPVASKIEQVFAEGSDQRHLTFKLFLKLPPSFPVRTPVGEYQPDWAIVKQDEEMVYLVRENQEKPELSEAQNLRSLQSSLRSKARRNSGYDPKPKN